MTMLHLGTILHPTDFSALSEHAFHLACSLARDHGGRLIILHVAEPPVVGYGDALTPPPQGDWKAIEERLLQIRAPDARVAVKYRLVEGDPATEILREARESNCDLIVLGTHGRTGLAHLLMGSVAEKVVRKASCPVLVAKAPHLDSGSEGNR
jgi:universal stress protein A